MKFKSTTKMFTAIFSLIIGIAALWFGFKSAKTYFIVKSWSQTEAIVLSKKVELHKTVSTGRSPYAVKVEYKYFFNSKEYTNNKVYLVELMGGQANHMKKDAEEVVSNLGEKIKVYVNPKSPSESVIFCDGILLNIVVLAMGFFALLYSVVSFVNAL